MPVHASPVIERYARKLMTMVHFGDAWTELSTCKRAKVAAVIFPVDCTAVHAFGYNGQPRGRPNDGCTAQPGACGCAHAEANAIARLDSTRVRNAILYSTLMPCYSCASLLVNSHAIIGVIYRNVYRSDEGARLLRDCCVGLMTVDQLEAESFDINTQCLLEHWHAMGKT